MLGSRAVTVDRARALLRLAHSDQESRVEAGLRGVLSTITITDGRLGSDLDAELLKTAIAGVCS